MSTHRSAEDFQLHTETSVYEHGDRSSTVLDPRAVMDRTNPLDEERVILLEEQEQGL